MQPTAKTKKVFFDVVNNNPKPLNLNVAKDLAANSGDRIGFGVRSGVQNDKQPYTLIYATTRPKRPGVLKHGWNQLIGRTETRKRAANAAVDLIKAKIKQVPGAKQAPGMDEMLSRVENQISKSNSVNALDLHLLLDAISDVEKANAAKEEQQRCDMAVKGAAQFVLASVRLDVLGLPQIVKAPGFSKEAAADFRAFILEASRGDENPPNYALAQAFAEQWVKASPENVTCQPRSRHLIDSVVKLVMRGCKMDVPPAVEQPLQVFTLVEDGKFKLFDGPEAPAFSRVKLLGAGGNAATFLYTSENGEEVAVKEFRADAELSRLDEAMAEAQIHNRAQAAGNHVVRILGTVKSSDESPDDNLKLVLEYAPNGDGAAWEKNILDDPALDNQAKLRKQFTVFKNMARGVKQVHDRGIMHLDVKPGNFVISAEDKPKLIDFGASRFALAEFMTSVVDSSDYTAPELIRARKQNTLVTERADIWSLGVMLFKITKGVLPFPSKERVSESFSLILEFAEKGWVTRFKQLGLDPTNELDRLIGEMLNPDPLKRPSAEEVLAHPAIATYAG